MPLTRSVAARAAGFETLRIAELRRETDDAICVGFEVPAGLRGRFGFVPGQYLTLRAVLNGEEVRRSYSICSGLDDGTLRVAIKRVEGGRFSGWAHGALAAGAAIDVMPPAGRFVVPEANRGGRSYLAVAAGSGITPVLSIMTTALTREKESRVALIYGSRSTGGILFREALEELKDRFMGRLSIVHVLSRERQDSPVQNGRIDGAKVAALLPMLVPGGRPDVALLCGPGGMIDSARAALVAAGAPAERILSERFFIDGAPPPRPRAVPQAGAAPFAVATVVADGIRTEVPLAEGETVLAGALRAGLDLPYSCRGGMCSTCRARVTEGAVTMDVNYALEPWETAAGYVLTCQSHPVVLGPGPGPGRVTVDYDHV